MNWMAFTYFFLFRHPTAHVPFFTCSLIFGSYLVESFVQKETCLQISLCIFGSTWSLIFLGYEYYSHAKWIVIMYMRVRMRERNKVLRSVFTFSKLLKNYLLLFSGELWRAWRAFALEMRLLTLKCFICKSLLLFLACLCINRSIFKMSFLLFMHCF